MPDNKIEVEYITTVAGALQAIEKLNRRLDQQETKLQKVGDTSKKTADGAINSFAKLEQTLKENEAALKGLAAGTTEFDQQLQKVQELRTEHAKLKQILMAEAGSVQQVAGSFDKLERELKDNEAALKKLVIGSKAFTDQKRKVDELRSSMESAKKSLAVNVSDQSGASDLVDKFTTSISGTVATIVSVGAIVGSLKTDLENIARKRENERLAEVDFGTALAARTISNLAPEERAAVKPLALDTANQLGMNPGAVVEAIGELRSSGAADIVEAANYLKEAANAFPQDLAAAKAIARAALIESSATGNRNPAQVIGGTIAAQSLSLTKNPEEFAKAFGSNIAASASVYKMKPEKAREEAAIFSLLETRSSEVAADAQRSFLTQVSKFVPEPSKKLKAGGTATVGKTQIDRFLQASFTERQEMIESDDGLRKQFFDSLQETGRTAIMRRVQPTNEDAAMIRTVQKGIGGDEESAAMLRQQQADAGQVAAFAISEGQRKAQKATAEIRGQSSEKLTAELEQTLDVVDERTRAGLGGSALNMMERVGAYVEQYASGQSRGEVLQSTLQFKAANETNPVDRDFAQQQVERIADLRSKTETQDEVMFQVSETDTPEALNAQAIKIVDDTMNKMNLSGVDSMRQDNIYGGQVAAKLAGGASIPEGGILALEEAKKSSKLFGVPMGGAVSDEDKAKADAAIEALQKIQSLLEQQLQKPAVKVTQPVSRPKASPLPAATVP